MNTELMELRAVQIQEKLAELTNYDSKTLDLILELSRLSFQNGLEYGRRTGRIESVN